MKPSDYFRHSVKEYIAKKGRGSQKALAQAAGITPSHLNDFLGERRVMVEEDQLKIVNAIDVDYINFLQHGKRLMEGKSPAPDEHLPFIIQINTNEEKNLLEKNAANYKGVPLLESGRLAAWSNGSAFDLYEQATSEVVVYLPELGHRANHHLVAARVGGDSMEPLVPENSIVIVDLDDKEFVDSKIYAVVLKDGGVHTGAIKRVRKFEVAKGFLLLSENTSYQPRLVVETEWNHFCVGRVIWMWRSFDR